MRRRLGILTLILITALPVSARAYGNETKQAAGRTISLDLGYIPPLGTNRSMHNLWLEYEYVGTNLFDLVSDKTFIGGNFLTRTIWSVADFSLWYILGDTGFFIANHEFGHGTRCIADNSTPTFTWTGGGSHTSIITFALEGFLHAGHSSSAFTSCSGGGVSGTFPTGWAVVGSAGGMNNSMMFAETLEDEVYYNTGHLLELAPYLHAKTDAFYYGRSKSTTNNDVTSITGTWQSLGYNITAQNVSQGGLVSFLADPYTYAFVWGLFRYIGTGDPNITAPKIGRFALPGLSFFENRNGLSYRLRTAYDTGSTSYPVSLEYVYQGKPTVEASFGIRHSEPIGNVRKTGSMIQGYINSELGLGLRAMKDFRAGSHSFFDLEGSIFTAQSLEGERNMGHMLFNPVGIEVAARYSIIY
ncbi:MAG TPA: hypothetical protein VL588_06810 [Bdellovibrionota bacterium]|nr:hypothetical protein [Bdellovibrionota bacterium]